MTGMLTIKQVKVLLMVKLPKLSKHNIGTLAIKQVEVLLVVSMLTCEQRKDE